MRLFSSMLITAKRVEIESPPKPAIQHDKERVLMGPTSGPRCSGDEGLCDARRCQMEAIMAKHNVIEDSRTSRRTCLKRWLMSLLSFESVITKKAAPTPVKLRYRCSRQGLADSRVAVVRATRCPHEQIGVYHGDVHWARSIGQLDAKDVRYLLPCCRARRHQCIEKRRRVPGCQSLSRRPMKARQAISMPENEDTRFSNDFKGKR